MNSHKSVVQPPILRVLRQFVVLPLVLSFLFIVVATLYPFNFSIQEDTFIHQLLGSLRKSSNLVDQVINIFLFVPFGFSLSRFGFKKTSLQSAIVFLIVLLSSLVFSTTIELLQTFLPSRASSLSDILTNTIGGVCGYFIYHLGLRPFGRKFYWIFHSSFRKLTVKQLTVAFIGYLMVVFLIVLGMHSIVNFTNWSVDFPLVVGNESTGDRSWTGTIQELAIADSAISEDSVAKLLTQERPLDVLSSSLITEYHFKNIEAFSDSRKHSPNLIWKGTKRPPSSDDGASLSSQNWLETSSSAKLINQRLKETSAFTLSLVVATGSKDQGGPARIVSLSQNPYERNLTIGQEKQDLIVRLRTPFSGNNGVNPEIHISNAFIDTGVHHFIITFADATLRVYMDRIDHLQTFGYTPELALLSYMIPVGFRVVKCVEFLHYVLIFSPLAFFLALITKKIKGNLYFYSVLAFLGVFTPALLVELFRVGKSYQSVSFGNVFLSICIFGVAFLIAKVLIRWSSWESVNRSDN